MESFLPTPDLGFTMNRIFAFIYRSLLPKGIKKQNYIFISILSLFYSEKSLIR